MQEFIPIKYSSLHTNSLCKLNAHIKYMGFAKIHFQVRRNHFSCNNISCLRCHEQMCFKEALFRGLPLPWLGLRLNNGRSTL